MYRSLRIKVATLLMFWVGKQQLLTSTSLWCWTLALSCLAPTVPDNSIMKGNNFTYGSKVTFRYHLHSLQHHVVLMTVGKSKKKKRSLCHTPFSAVWRASCLRSHTSTSVLLVWSGAGRHLFVTQWPAGGLQLLWMLTTPSTQTHTSLLSHIPVLRDTGMDKGQIYLEL